MYYFIYVTTPTEDEAKKIAKHLLEKKLVACVNFWKINSMYWWEGEVQEDGEYAMILKTKAEKFSEVRDEIKKIHSYTTPCICAISIEEGNLEFLRWIDSIVEG
ncbi:divalent-cation tolerance protein CutA [Geoglobus acetivorans]|uniref:Periplasmic divalent cation tolerance protein CutA n=1 Tax=Geoglobus acetivorans TaxID=565033 RepID=A0A0A7GB92_GEOAI|nr:Periplasmic divalent cation tolerance protein CutA [Geoglobus acetivorans]